MRRWAMTAAVALALAACQPAKAPAPAATAIDTASAAAHQAADQFAALAKGAETTGKPPRLTDAAAGPLLNTIFTTTPLVGPTPPFSEIGPVSDWMLSIARTGQVYVLAGTGVTDISKATSAINAQAGQNVATFAPELARYIDAEVAVTGVEADMVSQFVAANPDAMKDPTRADGLKKTRDGVAQIVDSVLLTVAADGPTDDWKKARVQALIAIIPKVGKLLPADQNQAAQQLAQQAASAVSDSVLQAELTQVSSLLAQAKPPS